MECDILSWKIMTGRKRMNLEKMLNLEKLPNLKKMLNLKILPNRQMNKGKRFFWYREACCCERSEA